MIDLIAVLIVLIVISVKVYWDNKNWGKVEHTKGIVLVSLILIPLCVVVNSLYPVFLFGTLFNPAINVVRQLPLFFIGNTAAIDIILKQVFPARTGESFFLLNFLGLIYTILG